MAQGDFKLFEEFAKNLGTGDVHDFGADTFKLGICTTLITPAVDDTTPRWVNYSGNEVATGNGYTANGETLTATTYAEVSGVAKFDAADVSLTQNTSGFTNAGWAVLYNDTAANDEAIGFVDMGGPVSLQAGNISFAWNASGIFTVTVTT